MWCGARKLAQLLKSAYCFSRGPEFNSHQAAPLLRPVTSIPGGSVSSTLHSHVNTTAPTLLGNDILDLDLVARTHKHAQ